MYINIRKFSSIIGGKTGEQKEVQSEVFKFKT